MVVNGFDNIRDKERCQRMILEQVAKLSPRTFKEASELVHFVSSNAIPVAPPLPPVGGGDNGGDGGGGSSGPPDNGPEDDDDDEVPTGKHGEPGSPGHGKGKGKDKEKIEDFANLEGALRRFVLEKRARSKLAPAKTYLLNCLGDMHVLATVNRDVAQSELDRVSKELSELEPEYEERRKQRTAVADQVEKDIDEKCTDVYNHSRSTLSNTIANVGDQNLGVEYPGLWSAFQYAEDVKLAMLDQIASSVRNCEDYGRAQSVQGVSMMKSLGLLHVGDSYQNMTFRADAMFQRRKDALARSVDTEVELWDFFDVAGLWERQEKVVGTGMAMTVVGTLGTRAIGGVGWVDGAFGAVKVMGSKNLRRMILPGIVAASKSTFSHNLGNLVSDSTV
jgi:mitofusin